MVRKTGLVLLVASASSLGTRALAGEECDKHGKGSKATKSQASEDQTVFGVVIESDGLRTALAGFELETEKVRCPACQKAIKTNGKCEHCKIGVVNGKAYRSPVSSRLAKGTPMPAELVAACPKRCDECKTAHKENGFCEHCGVGFVADRMY